MSEAMGGMLKRQRQQQARPERQIHHVAPTVGQKMRAVAIARMSARCAVP